MASVRVLRRVRERGFSLALPNILRSTHPIEACHTALPIANTTTVELGDRIRAAVLHQQELLHACRGYARLCDSPCTKPRRGDHGQDGLLFWREADGEQWHSRYAERLSLHGNFEGISKDLFELNVINREQVDGRRRVDRVVQKAVPVLKHKGERTPSDRKGKARALAMFDAEEEKGEEPNADAAVAALRTRGTAVS
ncbi:hypothetical protein PC129_g3786 [Phytophthora cactorum]|uniref:Uncharacterized protein n=1 Tax=Phytophthora cactorum TaxID=29920 RepID=A0A8T1ILJ8_9STRA|nr:hypothetical protein PC129_g3786 [Phytophthora cactorum]